jgi:hypothetical protein
MNDGRNEQENQMSNTESIKITATTTAWLASWRNVNDLHASLQKGKFREVVDSLSYASWDMGKGESPYTEIGEATITVSVKPRDQLAASQVRALQKTLEAERAKFMERQSEILEQINKLQALEYVA